MIICELGFDDPDAQNPNYSNREVDYYAWIPHQFQRTVGNHRLSLRKNLKTDLFEVYRHFHFEEKDEVVYAGKFKGALEVATGEWNRFHSGWANRSKELDEPCRHKYPKIDHIFCPKARE